MVNNPSVSFPSVDLDGVFQRRCLTCSLIDGCRFFKAEFSPNQTYFTLYCLGKAHPLPAYSQGIWKLQTAYSAGFIMLSCEKKSPGPGIPKVTVHSTKDPSSEYQICVWFICDRTHLDIWAHTDCLQFTGTPYRWWYILTCMLVILFVFVNTALCLWLSAAAVPSLTVTLLWWATVPALMFTLKTCHPAVLPPAEYVVLEDNSPLSKALEDKRLPETLFRTLPAENHGTTKR